MLTKKGFGRVLILLTVLFIIFVIYSAKTTEIIAKRNQPKYGISFTKSFAEYLGLDWRQVYLSALDDLKIRHLRIGLNWDEIEPESGKFIWEDFDWMVAEADKRQARIILGIGRKLPRWPECRTPSWALNLPEEQRRERILKMISEAVNHYKNSKAVALWQVQNEPFFRFFGSGCPDPDKKFLEREIALARLLDPSRPIMTTDSGELSLWWKSATLDIDILGVSMYRYTWNKYIGFRKYFFPPWVYSLKGQLVSWRIPKIIISELQAEPWAPRGFLALTPAEEAKTMSPDILLRSLDFARASGYDEIYLWGVEWWYYKKITNDPFYWDTIKNLISNRYPVDIQ